MAQTNNAYWQAHRAAVAKWQRRVEIECHIGVALWCLIFFSGMATWSAWACHEAAAAPAAPRCHCAAADVPECDSALARVQRLDASWQ